MEWFFNSGMSPATMGIVGAVCLAAGILFLCVWRTVWRCLFSCVLVLVGACLAYMALAPTFGLPPLFP